MLRCMFSHLGRFLQAAALVTVMVASSVWVSPAPAQAAVDVPADGYGFGSGAAPIWTSAGDLNRELDAVAQTGASWLRVPVQWDVIEKERGQFNWGYLDTVVSAARARNLKVLATIAFTPPWARPGNPMLWYTVPPASAADFAGFAATVVKRYADRVFAWQIWNEPNLPLFFGFTDNKPTRYAELLKAAYPAIKAVQPNSTVVAAGMSRLLGDESPPNFLAQMYAAGAGGNFDAAAAHPYVFPDGLAADPENGWSDVGRMHDVMAANGDGGKKIWLTEMGACTATSPDGVSQQEQARQIKDVLGAAARTSYIGPAFIYSIRDINTGDRPSREANCGSLLTSDWQPKVTASVLAR
jgi:polysaccharide biosynthesis protein PslG